MLTILVWISSGYLPAKICTHVKYMYIYIYYRPSCLNINLGKLQPFHLLKPELVKHFLLFFISWCSLPAQQQSKYGNLSYPPSTLKNTPPKTKGWNLKTKGWNLKTKGWNLRISFIFRTFVLGFQVSLVGG